MISISLSFLEISVFVEFNTEIVGIVTGETDVEVEVEVVEVEVVEGATVKIKFFLGLPLLGFTTAKLLLVSLLLISLLLLLTLLLFVSRKVVLEIFEDF